MLTGHSYHHQLNLCQRHRYCGQRHPRTLDMGADGARLRWPRLCGLAVAGDGLLHLAASERLHRRLKARVSPEPGQKRGKFAEGVAGEL
jgi:hypothetical protein